MIRLSVTTRRHFRGRRLRLILLLCILPLLLTLLVATLCTHRERLQDEAAVFILRNKLPVAQEWALGRLLRHCTIVNHPGPLVETDLTITTETPQLGEPIEFDTLPPAAELPPQ